MQIRTAVLAVMVSVGCGSAEAPTAEPPRPQAQATLPEATLLASLPGGNAVLMGGNYIGMQDYLQSSPFAKLLSVVDATSPGMREWATCWTKLPVKMLGAVKMAGGRAEMRFVTSGVDIAAIEACARRAGYPISVDPDRKYISIAIKAMQNTVETGYLVLPSGVIYTKMAIALGQPTPTTTDRAGLEADAATVAQGTAAGDARLVAQLEGVDRMKAMWFVGSAAETNLAAQLGTFSGTFDYAPGFQVDVTVQIKDAALATKIADTIAQLKQQASALGPNLGPAVEQMRFERRGEQLRAAIALDDAQLESLAQQLAGAMGTQTN